ncbi:hypothetical protein QE152_g38653 [Popillia japonica]|uniref:Uncharacterized protein n=1 Tax=Popillia japonica TaxID=7064 RepID=A0AAW1HWA6_POPJA
MVLIVYVSHGARGSGRGACLLNNHSIISLNTSDRVTTPTPRMAPIVVVPKPNNANAIGMCIDMRCANMAIERVRYVTATIDDIIVALNSSKFFSKLGLKEA